MTEELRSNWRNETAYDSRLQNWRKDMGWIPWPKSRMLEQFAMPELRHSAHIRRELAKDVYGLIVFYYKPTRKWLLMGDFLHDTVTYTVEWCVEIRRLGKVKYQFRIRIADKGRGKIITRMADVDKVDPAILLILEQTGRYYYAEAK